MRPEDLNRKLVLRRGTSTQDEYGSPVTTWADLATVWAHYQPVSDGEKLAANEVSATLSARFTIRYDSAWADLSALDRVTFDGREFDIFGVKEVEGRRQFLEITATTRAE